MNKILNIDLINSFIKEKNLTKAKFCNFCKISPYILKQIYSGNVNIGVKSIFKIARAMNIEIYKLFNNNKYQSN